MTCVILFRTLSSCGAFSLNVLIGHRSIIAQKRPPEGGL
jgi:hypothetical protein